MEEVRGGMRYDRNVGGGGGGEGRGSRDEGLMNCYDGQVIKFPIKLACTQLCWIKSSSPLYAFLNC